MFISKSIERFGFDTLKDVPTVEHSQLKKTAERVSKQLFFSELREPDRRSLLDVYKVLLELYRTHNSFTKLPSRYIALSPWVILNSMEEDKPELAALPGFLNLYFSFLQERAPRAVLPPLVHVFLLYYPVEKNYFNQLRKVILALFDIVSSIRARKLNEVIQRTGFFQEQGHKNLVSELENSRAISQSLQSFYLTGALERGRLTEFCLALYLKQLKSTLGVLSDYDQSVLIDDLLQFIFTGTELEFPTLRVHLANALLSPFQDHSPSAQIQEKLKAFFIKCYGDPRLNKSRWVGVSDESMAVMRQWLVEDTLEDFFKLLSYVAQTDGTADRHWTYRKRFWQAYLRKGYISEAWVALGPNARIAAGEFLGEKSSNYAGLRGVDRRHSSLIMKIGDLVITEWSHSGSYRAWHEFNEPPMLYRSEYRRDDLVSSPDIQGRHDGSVTGKWQSTLANTIYDNTSLFVNSNEYMHD